jgi:molybdopterin-guanine dinucleotide biosynthesis protein A
MKFHSPAILFAGGKSRRMGEDKALLPFGEYTSLSQFQYQRLLALFEKVYISTKHNKFDFDAKLILDIYEDSSPLVALISVFESLDVDEVFILSVDVPFVSLREIQALFDISSQADAILARSPKGIEPLCGIYKRSILPFAKAQLQKNNHKLLDLLSLVNSKYIDFTKQDSFMNLNRKAEYEQAKEKLRLSKK